MRRTDSSGDRRDRLRGDHASTTPINPAPLNQPGSLLGIERYGRPALAG